MAAACFRATYTLDGHKKLAKNRRWLDGFVSQQGQEGRLYDESGALVATARLAAAVLEEGAEIDRGLFGQNIIVTVDVPCSPEEVRGGGAGGQARAAPAAGLPAAPARAAPTLAESAVSSKTAAPSGRATAAGGRRTTFKAPRLMPAGPASVASEPRSMPPAPAATPRGFVPPTAAAVPQPSGFKAQPAQLLWQHPGSMQPGAAPTCVRSGAPTGLLTLDGQCMCCCICLSCKRARCALPPFRFLNHFPWAIVHCCCPTHPFPALSYR